MKKSSRYLKVVEWSEEDQCFVGRLPGLAFGGVHGDDEQEVYAELEDGTPLPPPTAGRQYSGKFNLRVGKELHERLALESLKADESLNSYCVKLLKDGVGV
jgi:predicted HicB family RNase H-like nuclease